MNHHDLPEGPLTIVFTDVEASTALRTGLGDEASEKVLLAHERVIREQVAQHGGSIVDTAGDSFVMAFASVKKALACALDIQAGLQADDQAAQHGIRVRIGINTGEVIRDEEGIGGEAVHAAARIASKAKGGEILVAEVVKQLSGTIPGAMFRDRGRFRLKGFPDRWHLYDFDRDGAMAPPPGVVEPASLVGRDGEMAELRTLVDQTAQGHGGLAIIRGEAGLGKTRLAQEAADLARSRGLRVFWGRCWEAVDTPPYWAWIQLLRQLVDDLDNQQLLLMLGPGAAEVARMVPAVAARLESASDGAIGDESRFALFDSIASFLKNASKRRGMMIVLEDLHAADEPSLLLLDFLSRQRGEYPLMILGTYDDIDVRRRPHHESLLSGIAREGCLIRLRPLDEASVKALYGSIAGEKPSDAMAAAVYRASEGNPLFVEEAVRMLTAKEEIHRPDFSVGFRVPQGVHDIIRHRLAALPDEVAAILAIAAVIGRHFEVSLLQKVSGLDMDALMDLLDQAVHAQVIVESSALGRYSFAHILIREALYEELTAGKRMRLHRRVGEVLEEAYEKDGHIALPELAHHWFKAAQAGDARKTMQYSAMAAKQAASEQAYEEAARLYQRALQVAAAAAASKDETNELKRALHDVQAQGGAPPSASEPEPGRTNVFRREGDYWTITFEGGTSRLKDSKGLRYLAHLLGNPRQELYVLDLAVAVEGAPSETTRTDASDRQALASSSFGDAGELLDPTAKARYKQRIRDLQDEVAEAETFNDSERASRARAELDALIQELSRGVGLGGRDRRAASPAERARINVTKTIKDALRRISEHDGALGDHLSSTIRTGTYCSYTPDPRVEISWQL